MVHSKLISALAATLVGLAVGLAPAARADDPGDAAPVDPGAIQQRGDQILLPDGRIIGAPPQVKTWSDVELAIRRTMDLEYVFQDAVSNKDDRAVVIAAWQDLLKRDDLDDMQRGYAWWRIAWFYTNVQPKNGDAPNDVEGAKALRKAREYFGDAVAYQSLNTATRYGSMRGAPMDQAKKLSESFRWLWSLDEDDIARSAEIVTRGGFILDRKFFPGSAHRAGSTLQEREETLRGMLEEYQESIAKSVASKIRYSQDPASIAWLLDAIHDVAKPEDMAQWRELEQEMIARVTQEQARRAALGR